MRNDAENSESDSNAPATAPLLVARLERLRWRSRRGLLELELLLAPFMEHLAQHSDEHLLDQYEALLEHDDLDLHEWLMDRSEPLPEVQPIVSEMRAFLSQRRG